MCPVCMTTTALATAGAATGAGVVTLVIGKWRDLRRWFGRSDRF